MSKFNKTVIYYYYYHYHHKLIQSLNGEPVSISPKTKWGSESTDKRNPSKKEDIE